MAARRYAPPRTWVATGGEWPDGPFAADAPPYALGHRGRRPARYRAAGGRSLRSVAREAGIDATSLGRTLAGETVPDVHTVAVLEDALGAALWPRYPDRSGEAARRAVRREAADATGPELTTGQLRPAGQRPRADHEQPVRLRWPGTPLSGCATVTDPARPQSGALAADRRHLVADSSGRTVRPSARRYSVMVSVMSRVVVGVGDGDDRRAGRQRLAAGVERRTAILM